MLSKVVCKMGEKSGGKVLFLCICTIICTYFEKSLDFSQNLCYYILCISAYTIYYNYIKGDGEFGN